MNKRTLFLLLAICVALAARAQCPTTYTILHNQAEVDAFPSNCTYLNVRLDIGAFGGSSDITDLTPLANLTGSSNKIYIWYNPVLTSLNGLQNLTEVVQDFTIQANPSLTDLSGLEGLQTAGALLKIENNDGLLTLDGLTAGGVITNLGSLVIIENDNLLDLGNVLDNLQTVDEYILFNKNSALTTIGTMNNLTSIGWYLSIEDNDAITTFNAFNGLTEVGLAGATWNIDITKHASLTSINDFVNLSQVGKNFDISNNSALSEISFPGLTSVGAAMIIAANPSLTSLLGLGDFTLNGPLSIVGNSSLPECEAEGICNYLDVPGNPATINTNAVGCNNRTQVLNACGLLPVELTFFKGKEEDGEVALVWQTASEKNNDYFQVEYSTDGAIFNTIGRVKGSGSTAITTNYSYRHTNPTKGTNYYRLKQVDFDGKYVYSDIISVESAHNVHVEIYPNPTTGYIKLKGELSEGTARLLDFTGHVISESHLPDEYLIDLTQQPEGIYFLEIQMDNEEIMKRVMKE